MQYSKCSNKIRAVYTHAYKYTSSQYVKLNERQKDGNSEGEYNITVRVEVHSVTRWE